MALGRSKHEEQDPRWLEVDATMTGTVVFKDPVNLQINGQFEGSLQAKGRLSIGQRAQVKATIQGEAVIIGGLVEGTVTATYSVELLSTGRVLGKVITPSLVVQEGAVINGTIEMATSSHNRTWMTIEELARYLEVDASTVTQWAQSGKLPAQRENNQWQFNRSKIEEWLAQEKVK
ncbi:MAG: polymer-forming cytoskeletal protein [Candidatus Omnitrophica bacterium]|nr:polymer-forming cytoskeletal protein [Candidatus Omnitrophota bacterium]MBI2173605.1 polymer-forming cytoskeletal protein [Candidatus Omnitrophota bacterium]MBI3010357.1 polymer-forming cytoskeletal protein [Candidatus Omnitrophota bacterium]